MLIPTDFLLIPKYDLAEKYMEKETKKEKPSNEDFSLMFLEVPSRFELL